MELKVITTTKNQTQNKNWEYDRKPSVKPNENWKFDWKSNVKSNVKFYVWFFERFSKDKNLK